MSLANLSDLASHDAAPSARIAMPRVRWLTRVGLPALILLLTAALLAYAARDVLLPATSVTIIRAISKPRSHDAAPASAAPVAAAAQSTAVVAQAAGWVEPDPFPIRVPALTDGVIKEMLVLEGAAVSPNQVVARMIDDDAKLAVQRAKAEAARRKAVLEAAQANWDHPTERERAVTEAQAMVAEAEAELAYTDARIQAEAAKTAELRSLLARMQSLPDSFVSEYELERTKLQVDAQTASVKATDKQRAMIEAKAKRASGELHAAKENARLRISEKAALEEAAAMHLDAVAALAEAELRLERMEVRAETGGIVMARRGAPGMRMMTSGDGAEMAYVVELYDPAKLQVRADVPLGDAAGIGVGQRAQIVVDVLPDRVFTGHVTRLVHQADIGKNTIQVKVAIDDPTAHLKPEMLAKVKFLAMTNSTADGAAGAPRASASVSTFVPRELVIPGSDDAASVWVVHPTNSTAMRKAITLGTVELDGWIEVLQGVNANDAVIVNARDIEEGERVRISSESAQ